MFCPRPHRRWRAAVAAVALSGLVGGTVAETVGATTADEQKRKVEDIAELLEGIGDEIDQLGEDYAAAQDQKDALDLQIAESQAKVDRQQAQLDVLQATLTKIAVVKYTSGATTEMSPLFADAGAYSDAQQRDELNRITLDNGAGDVDQMQALAADLAKEKEILQAKQRQAADLVVALDEKQTRAEELQSEYQVRLVDAQATYGELLREEQERREAAAIARAQEVARQRAADAAAQAAADQAVADTARSRTPTTARGGGTTGDDGADTPAAASGSDASAAGTSNITNDGGSTAPPPSSRAGIAVAAAYSQLGVTYRFAAESPGVAFDCSGLTKYAWGQAGIGLPHQSAQQYASIPHVSQAEIQPGDLIFYYAPIGHVAIYVGGGSLIHAPRTGDVVKVAPVNWGKVVGVGRPG